VKYFGKYFLISLALFGFIFSIYMIIYSSKKPKMAPIAFQPPKPPYKHFVAGVGIIEAASDNIEIGTPFSEVVDKVYACSGDCVKKNDPLYKLNTQTLEAHLQQLIKLKEVREKILEDQKMQFSFYQRLKDKNAVSESEYQKQYYNLQIAKKELDETIATINITKTNIERSTIRAPIDGVILDTYINSGENAQANPFQKPYLLLFGSEELSVKVFIDETDSWRVYKNAKATAYVRGNSSIKLPLEFIKIDSFIKPKYLLTGESKEKVDVRVLQVSYKLKKNSLPIYIGQLLDVYIEALPSDFQFDENDIYKNK